MPDLQAFTLIDVSDVDMLYIILAAVFMPAIMGLLLELIALWLPDDGYVLKEPRDNRQHDPNDAEGDGHDWRRAA